MDSDCATIERSRPQHRHICLREYEDRSVAKRFYFDLSKRETILADEIGSKAADLEEALKEAAAAIQELWDSGEAADVGEGWQLLIRDETGTVLRMLPV